MYLIRLLFYCKITSHRQYVGALKAYLNQQMYPHFATELYTNAVLYTEF